MGTARHRLLLALGACAALVAVGAISSAVPASEAQGQRPNVIVIMTDDQRLDDLQVMRATRREFVRGGVSFRKFYTTLPWCCPSRVTFLTGQYAHNHGIYSGRPPDGGYSAFKPDQNATMPVALHDAGYRTALLGKYLNGYPRSAEGPPGDIPPGWDNWQALIGWKMFDFPLNFQGEEVRIQGRSKYLTDVLARRAAAEIRNAADSPDPLFMSVMTLAPHREPGLKGTKNVDNPRPARRHRGRFGRRSLPSSPAMNEFNMSDKPPFLAGLARRSDWWMRRQQQLHQDRLASLLAVDDLVERVMDELRATGQLDDTYVLFTSDNGFLLGEHRLTGKNKLYEEGARVPMMIRGPGLPAGQRVKEITGNIDLAPTIYDIADVGTPPIEPDGVSLLEVAGDTDAFAQREIVLEKQGAEGLRTPDWTYIEHDRDDVPGPDQFELYDMRTDPWQLMNLYAKTLGPADPDHDPARYDPVLEAERIALAARLDELRECAGDECREP